MRKLETWKFPIFRVSVVMYSRHSFFWVVMRCMLVFVFGNWLCLGLAFNTSVLQRWVTSLNSEGLNLETGNPCRICLKTEEKEENLCQDGRSQGLPYTYWLETNSAITKTPKAPNISVTWEPLLCWHLQVYLRYRSLIIWIECQYNCTLLVIWFDCIPVVLRCPAVISAPYVYWWSSSGINWMPLMRMSPKQHCAHDFQWLA